MDKLNLGKMFNSEDLTHLRCTEFEELYYEKYGIRIKAYGHGDDLLNGVWYIEPCPKEEVISKPKI